MKIKLLEDWLNGDDLYKPSEYQVLEVPDEVGEQLIFDGIAERAWSKAEQEARARGQMSVSSKKKRQLISVMGGRADMPEAVTLDSLFFGKEYTGGGQGLDDPTYLECVRDAKKGIFRPELKTLTISDSTGGYLVPDILYAQVLDRIKALPSLLERCTKFQTEGSGLKIPAFMDYDWSAGLYSMDLPPAQEDTTLLEREPEFEQLEFSLHKHGFTLPITNELLEDSRATLGTMLPMIMSKATAFGIDYLILNGVGGAQPLGIINAPCTVEVSAETDQDSGTLLYQNLTKMFARLTPGAEAGAVWLVSRSCFPYLAELTINVGTGGAVMWLTDATGKVPASIFGLPVIVHPHCSVCGTKGDIVLGNFSSYGILGKSTSPLIRVDFSEHVEFKKDKSVWRCIVRFDGHPLMSDKLIDADGSTELSNFIVLETRD